jgi:hypothetical protein
MSKILESIPGDVSFDRVPEYAQRFLDAQPHNEHGAVILLEATVASVTVQCEALMNIVPARTYPGYEVLEITWRAREGGPYPVFHGTLSAEQEALAFCRLELDGTYKPPGSIAGMIFDEMLGHRIAEATAHQVLGMLKTAFEAYAKQPLHAG